VSQQPAYPVFCFEGQKVPYPVSSFFSARYKTELEKSHYSQDGRVASDYSLVRQSSVRVTPLLYLFFLLMYLHKIVSKKFSTPCDVHFEKPTSVFGLGLGLAFGIMVLC